MIKRILQKYRSYLRNDRGFAAIILAFMLPALVSSAGIAVDISTAYNSQSRLSNALDKAVLATASSNSSGLTSAQLQARFMAFFNANYPSGKYGTPFNVNLTIDGSVMTATASAAVPTSFMSIVGITNLNVTATSQVVQTLAGVEAVLVLDTTGSMAGNNIAALQTASTNFINIMFNAIQNVNYIKIGIVPWSDNVNVGPYGWGLNPGGDEYEGGIKFVSPPATDPYVSPASSISYGSGQLDWGGCVVEPNAAALEQDYTGVNWQMFRYPPPSHNNCLQYACNQYDCEQQTCTQYNCKTYQCATYACAQYNCTAYDCGGCPHGDTIDGTKCKPSHGADVACTTPGTSSNGAQCATYGTTCVQQGACSSYSGTCQTYYTSSNQCATWTCTTPGSAANGAACAPGQTSTTCLQYATGPNDGCTSVPILPMTNSQSALLAEINALPTANNTYSDVGMAWGWRTISPGFPFEEGASYSDNTWSKSVILMTDGNNTINTVMSGEGAYGATGTSMTTTDQNNKFEQVCTAMKAMGIRIYTITFQSAINDTTRAFYKNCATNTSMYYDAPTNADLTTAFQNIATQLSQLHLTQ